MRKPLGTLASLGVGAALWGHWEAGWVRLRELPVQLPGLAPELDGLRIVHLSDFHLGFPSRGRTRGPPSSPLDGRPQARPRRDHG